ncbi:hypothetical protein Pmani_007374 [Petrolisthes manimaculis]|uniref:Carbohydrate sulfotransferase n=1 Tax=Petrolisthes manimaculis TaxID=1843537 RepID=A0AAE1Q8P2_9EUCA|nr:hypothetical protein Pmani_007374 [Petrolisthes manimaculis]
MRELRLFRILTCRKVATFLFVAVVMSWSCRLWLENDRRITHIHNATSITASYRSPIYKIVHYISEKVQNEDVTFPRPISNIDRDNNPSNRERGGKNDGIFPRFTTFANISDSNIIRDKQVENIALTRPEPNIVNTENIKKPTVKSTTPAMNTTGDLGDWKKVIRKRQKRVEQICKENYHTLKRFHIDDLFIIDTKHHLAYCRNAKAGTTTILGYMLTLAGVNITGMSPDWIHYKANSLFRLPDAKTVGRELNGQAVTFLIARHPFTRLVSAYRDKILSAGYQNLKKYIVKKYHKRETDTSLPSKRLSEEKSITLAHNQESNITTNLNSNDSLSAENMTPFQSDSNTTIQNMKPGINQPTFREFVLYVTDIILKCSSKIPGATEPCMKKINVHWRPLYERCTPCDIKYKVYAKMETFQQDIQYLSKLSGIDISLGKLNEHKENTLSLYQHYLSMLTQNEQELIYKAYNYDYLLFGYTQELQ